MNPRSFLSFIYALSSFSLASYAQTITVTTHISACSATYTSGQSTTVIESTVTVQPTPWTDVAANAGTPFVIRLEQTDISGYPEQGTAPYWLTANGNTTTNSSSAAVYYISDGQLLSLNGSHVSTNLGVVDQAFALANHALRINATFSVENRRLYWTNPSFTNGTAQFYKLPPGLLENAQILVKFLGPMEAQRSWSPVILWVEPVNTTSAASTSTDSVVPATGISTISWLMPPPASSMTYPGHSNPATSPGTSVSSDEGETSVLSSAPSTTATPVSSTADPSVVPSLSSLFSSAASSLSSSASSLQSVSSSASFSALTSLSSSASSLQSLSSSVPSSLAPILATGPGSASSPTTSTLDSSNASSVPTMPGNVPPSFYNTDTPSYSSMLSQTTTLLSSEPFTTASTEDIPPVSSSSSVTSASSSASVSVVISPTTSLPSGPSTTATTDTTSPVSSTLSVTSASFSGIGPVVTPSSSVFSTTDSIVVTSSSGEASSSTISSALVPSSSSTDPSSSLTPLSSPSSINPSFSLTPPSPSSSTKPSSSLTSLSSSSSSLLVSSTTSLTTGVAAEPTFVCPDDDGKTVTDMLGASYTLRCFSDTSGGGPNYPATSSFNDCFGICDTTAGCEGFSYRGGVNGVGAGVCYIKVGVAHIDFQGGAEGIVGAILIAAQTTTSTGSSLTEVTQSSQPTDSSLASGSSSSVGSSLSSSVSDDMASTTGTSSSSATTDSDLAAVETSSSFTSSASAAPSSTSSSSSVDSTSMSMSSSSSSTSVVVTSTSTDFTSSAPSSSIDPSEPSAAATSSSSPSTSTYPGVLASPTPCDFGDPPDSDEDDSYCEIDLPFDMTIHGFSDRHTFASTNGYLSLANGSAAFDSTPPLPNPRLPYYTACPYFDDLMIYAISPGQGIYFQVTATAVTYEWIVGRYASPETYDFTLTYDSLNPGVFVYEYYVVGQGNDGASATVGAQGLRDGDTADAVSETFGHYEQNVPPGLTVTCDTNTGTCTSSA